MSYSVIQHLRYNAWANSRIADLLSPLDDELFYEEAQSSFPSIAKTLLHIWDAETVWMLRMKGTSLGAMPSLKFTGTRQELMDGFTKSSSDLVTFIESRGEAYLSEKYSYKNLKGDPFTDMVEDTLFHVVNHGTYHRGQITTMLRCKTITTLVSTDLIHYLRSVRS
jgi:uncharacterized damage-inducible protein DinB